MAAAIVFAIATATAPAGNRGPSPTLAALPGPTQVTYGEEVSYTASLANTQNSTYTHVVYTHAIPTTWLGGAQKTATLVYASCDLDLSNWDPPYAPGEVYACPGATVPARTTYRVLLIWQTPGQPDNVGDEVTCDAAPPVPPANPVNDCKLSSTGRFTIKEGTGQGGSAGPDTFPPLSEPPLSVTTDLLGATSDLTKARAYALDECGTEETTLGTSAAVDVGQDNRTISTVCVPTLPGAQVDPLQPGVVVQIDESNSGSPMGPPARLWETVFVCVPGPDSNLDDNAANDCPVTPGYPPFSGADRYEAWPFDDPETETVEKGTFVFVLANVKGEKLEEVFHNGKLDSQDDSFSCTITYSNPTKTTTVMCEASENGGWDFN